jgi:hypothetical protein
MFPYQFTSILRPIYTHVQFAWLIEFMDEIEGLSMMKAAAVNGTN